MIAVSFAAFSSMSRGVFGGYFVILNQQNTQAKKKSGNTVCIPSEG